MCLHPLAYQTPQHSDFRKRRQYVQQQIHTARGPLRPQGISCVVYPTYSRSKCGNTTSARDSGIPPIRPIRLILIIFLVYSKGRPPRSPTGHSASSQLTGSKRSFSALGSSPLRSSAPKGLKPTDPPTAAQRAKLSLAAVTARAGAPPPHMPPPARTAAQAAAMDAALPPPIPAQMRISKYIGIASWGISLSAFFYRFRSCMPP